MMQQLVPVLILLLGAVAVLSQEPERTHLKKALKMGWIKYQESESSGHSAGW